MSFRGPAQWFKDILQSIERIESHVAGMSFDAFREDIKTIDAVERNFQKISEAAIRLGSQAERLCPGPPWPIFEALVTGSAINMTASILKRYGIRRRRICRC